MSWIIIELGWLAVYCLDIWNYEFPASEIVKVEMLGLLASLTFSIYLTVGLRVETNI